MRRAFTLFELLLVLALMVIMAAVIAPSLGLFTNSQRLRDAANMVRAEWARARVQAMKSGRMHVFRYEPDGARYAVDYWIAEDDALEAGDDSALARPELTAGGAQSRPAQSDLSSEFDGKELPDGVRFFVGDAIDDARSLSIQAQIGGVGTGAEPSPPVLFYSDGTTSTAEVIVINDRGRAIRISLRGLTGVATVSDVFRVDGGQK